MNDKNALTIVKEMTAKIKAATSGKIPINEKRYQYSKDECETIFNNVYKAVEEYTKRDTSETGYETLLNSLSDRFKVTPTGGSVSRQVDALSSAEFLYANQTKFQELLDNAKDVVVFIEDKVDKLPGIKVSDVSDKKEVEAEVPPAEETPNEPTEKEKHVPPAK